MSSGKYGGGTIRGTSGASQGNKEDEKGNLRRASAGRRREVELSKRGTRLRVQLSCNWDCMRGHLKKQATRRRIYETWGRPPITP